jgi:hypothetical protein
LNIKPRIYLFEHKQWKCSSYQFADEENREFGYDCAGDKRVPFYCKKCLKYKPAKR